MIKKYGAYTTEIRENMRGGCGSVSVTNLLNAQELNKHAKMFAKLVLKKGDSIGYHVHEGEEEIFYILSGTGVYSDNGIETVLSQGDCAVTKSGQGHGVANNNEKDLVILASILRD